MKHFITFTNVFFFFLLRETLIFTYHQAEHLILERNTTGSVMFKRGGNFQILNLYLHTVMLHANVGLTYLQTGGSPKPSNESTSLTPLCNCIVLVCPSFYTFYTQLSVSGKYINSVSLIIAPPMCTPHSQNAETFPSSFNFWDKGYRTPVMFFNVQSLKTTVIFLCHFP